MTAAEAPVREGDILAGKYRVEKVLGVGGMGVVVAALHLELDQRVALKFLLPSAAENPAIVTRFSREARAAAKIHSEHVVRVIDVGMLEGGLPYIVMEYLQGTDLAGVLLKETSLPIAVAVDYLLQACEAIAEAHGAGIVHRDLKPGNLFLARSSDGSEIVKVLDFGISKAAMTAGDEPSPSDAALTRTTDVFGSPMYMSPDQLKASRDVDARADIWALGVILFELITGRAPFEDGTIAEIFGAILHKPAPLLRTLLPAAPAGLEQVIARCLEKERENRFFNVAELAHALLPFGSRHARDSVDRIARVLRLSGAKVAALPPSTFIDDEPSPEAASAPMLLRPSRDPAPVDSAQADSAVATNLARTAATATSTEWGSPDGVPKSGSGARALVIGALAVAFITGAAFMLLRAPSPASHGGAAASALSPASAAPSPTPIVATPTVAPASSAVDGGAVVVAVTPAVSSARAGGIGGPRRTGKLVEQVPSAAPQAPPPPAVTAPPKPPAPKEDPDDFGDRQ